ncbi:hypothetical protein BH10BDE1_BH10BDE1_27880 [soil metagenome]
MKLVQDPVLPDAALFGLAGDFVKVVGPHTESDPAALLYQFLAAYGNCIGRKSYVTADSNRHHGNVFVVLVGKSAKGRKGTSWGHVANLFRASEPEWFARSVLSGLTSGEGLIASVRDSGTADEQPEPPGWNPAKELLADKRRLVIESEFAGLLRVLQREGNRLSPVIRDAWDGSPLNVLTKTDPLKATDAHISIVGHITETELIRYLSETEALNGFGNRFLWVATKRARLLPFGGEIDPGAFEQLSKSLRVAIRFADEERQMKMTEAARARWISIYSELGEEKDGLYGTLVARSEPMVLRIALLFALLESSRVIDGRHLDAALAAWSYCDQSCYALFGAKAPSIKQLKIIDALEVRADGLTQTEISVQVFQRNQSSQQIKLALEGLAKMDLVRRIECTDSATDTARSIPKWILTKRGTNHTNFTN